MLKLELLADAQRQFEICNACRYCEGICAVFPALESIGDYDESSVLYVANLCHDCRACLYVCPFGPPHEFAVNIPKVMSEVRVATYATHGWPTRLGRVLRRPRFVGALLLALVALVVGVSVSIAGVSGLFSAHLGEGSFYAVMPWLAMVIPALVITVFAAAVMARGGALFWREIHSDGASTLRAVPSASVDAAILRFLNGGGAGCNYPDEKPGQSRRLFHTLVFGGFLAAFASTSSAAILQDVMGVMPPYPLLSAPVILGSIGGAAMIFGSSALLWEKRRSDREPATEEMNSIDVQFNVMLLLVNVSGFMLLIARDTPLMGLILDAHLGFFVGLFLTMPYGKFVHFVYRYLALVRFRTRPETVKPD